MALYLGDKKVKIFVNGDKVTIPQNFMANRVKLLTSDDYVLKDINGLYLTIKEDK